MVIEAAGGLPSERDTGDAGDVAGTEARLITAMIVRETR